MAEELPSKITIRGGLTSSERVANWVRFDHDALAELAEREVEGPFVIDHASGIDAIAGQVIDIKAERREIEVNTRDGPRKENATFLTREAVLTDDNPAFELAARHILAMQKAGKIAHTSIALQAGGMTYDADADELRLTGPMRFIHDSLVSRGAFSPAEDGVGAMEVEFSAGENFSVTATTIDSEGAEHETVVMSAGGYTIQNMDAIVARFSADYATDPDALAALRRAGLAEESEPEPEPETAPEVEESASSEVSNNHSGVDDSEGTMSLDTDTAPDAPNEVGEAQAMEVTPTPSGSEAIAELEARIQRMEQERQAEKDAEAQELAASVKAEQDRLIAEFDLAPETVSLCGDLDSLRALRVVAEASQSDSDDEVEPTEPGTTVQDAADLPSVHEEMSAYNKDRFGVGA